jgi:hypothetical protein
MMAAKQQARKVESLATLKGGGGIGALAASKRRVDSCLAPATGDNSAGAFHLLAARLVNAANFRMFEAFVC